MRISIPFAALAAAIVATLSVAHPVPLDAQGIWSPRSESGSVTLEFLRPSFSGEGFGALSGVLFARVDRPVSEKVRFVGGLAVASGSIEGSRSSVFGSPYLGVEIGSAEGTGFAELGVHIPVSQDFGDDDFSRGIGLFADVDRWEPFFSDVVNVLAVGNYRKVNDSGFVIGVRAGPSLWMYTGEFSDESPDIDLLYGGLVGYEQGRGSLVAMLTGRWTVTAEDAGFGEASSHQLGIQGAMAFGNLRPSLTLRLPVDEDLSDAVNYTLGAGLEIALH